MRVESEKDDAKFKACSALDRPEIGEDIQTRCRGLFRSLGGNRWVEEVHQERLIGKDIIFESNCSIQRTSKHVTNAFVSSLRPNTLVPRRRSL
jgi:hypothetical protein